MAHYLLESLKYRVLQQPSTSLPVVHGQKKLTLSVSHLQTKPVSVARYCCHD